MTVTGVLVLAAVGMAGGVISTVASVASVVTYPALLAFGLPPLAANMTNTVSLMFTGAGAAAGSRPELAGQGPRVRRLGLLAALGGGAGAALLLATPAGTFQRAAPVLIGAASLILLAPARRRGDRGDRQDGGGAGGSRNARDMGDRQDSEGVRSSRNARDCGNRRDRGAGRDSGNALDGSGRRRALLAALFAATMYTGYFGAAGGILLLALLARLWPEPFTTSNALKNVASGFANAVAAVAFAAFGRVDWAVVPPLAAGFLAGGWTGPALVRRLPGRALRILVGCCGLAVAARLGFLAYR